MKAISLWQPWASLWLSPNKRHETRHWATKHRGPLLVHAAKRFERDVDPELDDILSSEFGNHWGQELPTGALIGLLTLEDCIPTERLYESKTRPITNQGRTDLVCGDFSEGRFGWRRGPEWKVFREHIPFKGHQGLPRDFVEPALATAKVFT